jgi:predicted transposase/invertase (TIGR01784 family)
MVDFAFQKTFGSIENKICLISLLNAILDLPNPLVDVTLESPFNLKDFDEDKLSIVDVKARDEQGAIFHIEIQLSNNK